MVRANQQAGGLRIAGLPRAAMTPPRVTKDRSAGSRILQCRDALDFEFAVTLPSGVEPRREFPYPHFLKVSYFGAREGQRALPRIA